MKDIWIAGGKMLLISLGSGGVCHHHRLHRCAWLPLFTQRLRLARIRKVESFGLAEMSKFSTASLITRSTNDVTQVQMFITMGLCSSSSNRRLWRYGPCADRRRRL